MGRCAVACGAAVCLAGAALAADVLAADVPLGTFGGFAPGMTKAAAKAAGYGDCQLGSKTGARPDSVFCQVPEAKRQLGTLKAIEATLEFKAPKHERVDEIHVVFGTSSSEAMSAIAALYGKPWRINAQQIVWVGDGPLAVKMLDRSLMQRTLVTFVSDPALGKAVKATKAQNEKDQKTLKGF